MAEIAHAYIHGTDSAEQERLALLNRLSNPPFLAFLGEVDGLRVLEVGSGLGILASDVAKRNPNGFTAGLEFSRLQLQTAQKLQIPGVVFCQGDGHRLPFTEKSFDLVYCRYLLEHVWSPTTVLREIRRILRPGGRVVAQENNIIVNHFYPDCPAFDLIWGRFVELQEALGGDALIGKKLFALFREAGFRDMELSIQPEVHWHGSPGFRPWVENLIGNIRSAESELVREGLAASNEIESAIRELDKLMVREDASAYFYWNRAIGYR